MSTDTVTLTGEQVDALFNILTHHETYAEVEGFKSAEAVTQYGYPFKTVTQAVASSASSTKESGDQGGAGGGGLNVWGWGASSSSTPGASSERATPRSKSPAPPTSSSARSVATSKEGSGDETSAEDVVSTSPLLQLLVANFVLRLPGVRDLPRESWSVRIQGLLARLGNADLSESYDKGAMGTRKTLATGSSSIIEMLARGVLGGVERMDEIPDKGNKEKEELDSHKAKDLARAWDEIVQGLVYGDLLDGVFAHFKETDDLDAYSPTVRVAVDYVIIHLATFVHTIFIESPEGQYMLKLIENVNNLVPYKMIKQTLRIGNAATMINGMMRLLLAKLSVTSITNWVGLTANEDDGMNLLQRIISLVLSWDANEFKKTAEKVEKAKEGPSQETLRAIREHIHSGRGPHELMRKGSVEHSQSIIVTILNASDPDLASSLTESQHAQCLEYYSALLSVRDRNKIAAAFCQESPDLFTKLIRDGVAAYEPMIRSIHARVDLREHLEGTQGFIDEFLKTSKGASGSDSGKTRQVASVEDYVKLLRNNRPLLHKWVHALATKCPDIWEDFRVWTNESLHKFRQDLSDAGASTAAAGGEKQAAQQRSVMDAHLIEMIASLDDTKRKSVLSSIDSHAEYLATLKAISDARLEYLSMKDSSDGDTDTGPGIYLARWRSLLNETLITPSQPGEQAQLRYGKDVRHTTTMGKTGANGAKHLKREGADDGPDAPDVSVVVEELGDKFRELIRDRARRLAESKD